MSDKTRRFHLGDILSVTTPKLLSPDGMDGVWALLEFMSGERLEIWQLMRVSGECSSDLLRQHPALVDVQPPTGLDDADLMAWFAGQMSALGEWLDVAPLAAEDHTVIAPFDELLMTYPHFRALLSPPARGIGGEQVQRFQASVAGAVTAMEKAKRSFAAFAETLAETDHEEKNPS
jgi:hypothetical protein